jgi:isocitrate/isopropylmalate dehydrogenase
MLENLAIRHSDERLDICGNILQKAISELLSSDGPKTYDIGGSATTSEVGDAVASRVHELLKSKFG